MSADLDAAPALPAGLPDVERQVAEDRYLTGKDMTPRDWSVLCPYEWCTAPGAIHRHLSSAGLPDVETISREVAEAALTDFIYEHGSDFADLMWPGMGALRAALEGSATLPSVGNNPAERRNVTDYPASATLPSDRGRTPEPLHSFEDGYHDENGPVPDDIGRKMFGRPE